jgi:Protein of unknown function (DUF4435)
MLKWPERARLSLAYLFRPLQEVDVYVEDINDEVFYSELINTIAPKGLRVARVFAVGNRSAVIEEARTHEFSERRALFLIDGDFEWVRDEPPPSQKGIFRLEAYCIENLLLHERPVVQVFIEEALKDEAAASMIVGYDKWIEGVSKVLSPLFISFAIANKVVPDQATVGLGVGNLMTQRGRRKLPEIDPKKVRALDAKINKQIEDAVGATKSKELRAALEARIGVLTETSRIVSGKDFLLPLLLIHLSKCGNIKFRRDSFRIRLARHCDRLRFSDLSLALERAARN